MPKPRNKFQNTAIHALLNKHHIGASLKAEIVERITNGRTTHSSEMYFHEANQMIEELGGTPQNIGKRSQQALRTKAGIIVLASPDQIELIGRLGTGYFDTAEGLKTWITKRIGHPTPRTSKEAQSCIEALKQMVARKSSPTTKEAA